MVSAISLSYHNQNSEKYQDRDLIPGNLITPSLPFKGRKNGSKPKDGFDFKTGNFIT
jgi:hypothetical protein